MPFTGTSFGFKGLGFEDMSLGLIFLGFRVGLR